MNDFILHHYPFSPYSEKVRVMLAYAGIDWLSVIHKEMPPRPELEPLAGNYSRIPVAQINSDVFCDSNIIAEEIAKLANKPELILSNASQEVQDFVEKVEGKIFFACVLGGGSAKLRKKIRETMSWWDIVRFFIDRIKMGATATTDNMIKMGDAKKILREHLIEMEALLDNDFIFGEKVCVADFAAYHSLWFVRDVGECEFMNEYPKVCAWMDRVKNLGEVTITEISGAKALSIAKNSQPRELEIIEGVEKEVAVAPSDYRQIKTTGILKFEDKTRWVISNNNERAGAVHIHFPRRGYKIS
jgi:glutathione S-transferase